MPLSFLTNKLTLALGVTAAVAAAGAAFAAKAYVGAREDVAATETLLSASQASLATVQEELARQKQLARQAEAARIALADEVARINAQGAETITEIKEVWRDREVIVEVPVAVECASTRLPDRVVGLLCEAAGSDSGACSLHTPAGGPDDELPDAPSA